MIGLSKLNLAALGLAGAALFAVPASADTATLLGVSKKWSAYQTTTGGDKVCYAMSVPKTVEPKKATRDPIYFLVSDWPGRKAKAEPEIVPGYAYKDGSTVTAQVGKEKFEFFTKNDGGSGSAWMQTAAEERRLLAAMQKGSQVVVTGISEHGTTTKDTYALSGLGKVLEKIHTACGL